MPKEPLDFHKPFLTSLVVIALVIFGYNTMGAVKVSTQNSAGAGSSLSQSKITPPPQTQIAAGGKVYVADTQNNRIQKFDSNGNFILKWGSFGNGKSEFHNPWGVAVDNLKNVYVVDNGNNRIQKFDSNGNFILMFGWGVKTGAAQFEICTTTLCSPGIMGSNNGQFHSPLFIAVDSFGNLYVTDNLNYRVQKFSSSGSYIGQWGGLSNPFGIAVDSSDNVYVVDNTNNKVQKFNSNGALLFQWGTYGFGNSQFIYPRGIAVDKYNNVYVSDSTNIRVQKFDSSGSYLLQWGTYGLGHGQFMYPVGMATEGVNGNIYVGDVTGNRIQKFDPLSNYILEWGSPGSNNGQLNNSTGIAIEHELPDIKITNIHWDGPFHVNATYPYLQYDLTIQNVGTTPVTLPTTFKVTMTRPAGGVAIYAQVSPGTPITLAPNQTYTFNNVNTVGYPNMRATPTTWLLSAYADSSNVIDESNENNNTLVTSVQVLP